MRKIKAGKAFPLGASVSPEGKLQFVIKGSEGKKYGIILNDRKTGQKEKICFEKEHRIGNLLSLQIEGVKPERISYLIEEDGKKIIDPYAKVIYGNEKWAKNRLDDLSAGIYQDFYDWENDHLPHISMEESIIYQLHVRGFTKHFSSGVKKKGTFEGIVEKISYLKDLGITTLELLPAYEFYEAEGQRNFNSLDEMRKNAAVTLEEKINYWGFKEGFYFVPKASYSASKHPQTSFKDMVKSLHREGMEVIMQFYFPASVSRSFIIGVLKFWKEEYHVDGFRLLGVNIPIELIASMEEFCNIKLLYEFIRENEVYSHQDIPSYRNLASYNDRFMYAIRRFLKSDVGSLRQAFEEMTEQGNKVSNIVYLTNYNTFTLQDLVSYNRKHNENNGEHGQDGNNENFSWNCGIEGKTKKKNILELRRKQQKNALVFLLLAKGTPVILAGDEFANSQGGNNNPYCQDNVISWLNWKDLERNREHFLFCKKLITLRKKEKLYLSLPGEHKGLDNDRFPYISFHGKEAWKIDWSAANEEAGGILYFDQCRFIYVGINMFWKDMVLAIPNLPLKENWKVILDTSKDEDNREEKLRIKQISIPSRSIIILRGEGKEEDDR